GVGHVQAEHVDTGLDQLAQPLHRPAGRPDRGDNLRAGSLLSRLGRRITFGHRWRPVESASMIAMPMRASCRGRVADSWSQTTGRVTIWPAAARRGSKRPHANLTTRGSMSVNGANHDLPGDDAQPPAGTRRARNHPLARGLGIGLVIAVAITVVLFV